MTIPFSSPNKARTVTKAFTLIELLVVIAIIAILAAILFPVFARARENARKASCQSNLKQLGIMMLQYTQDYDEQFPITFHGTSAVNTRQPWMRHMQPYIKSTQVMQCPSEGSAPGWAASQLYTGGYYPVHYAYNFYIGGNNADSDNSINVAAMVKPAETVLMCDSGGTVPTRTNPDGQTVPAGTIPEKWPRMIKTTTGQGGAYTSWILIHAASGFWSTTYANYGAPYARHFNQTNVLWADGHVKSQRMEQIMATGTTLATGGLSVYPTTCFDPERGCSG